MGVLSIACNAFIVVFQGDFLVLQGRVEVDYL
jgi:hypothetical protein